MSRYQLSTNLGIFAYFNQQRQDPACLYGDLLILSLTLLFSSQSLSLGRRVQRYQRI